MFEKDIREKDFKKKYPKSLKTPTFMHQQLQCPTKKKILARVYVKDKISKYSKSINFIIKIKKKKFMVSIQMFMEPSKLLKKEKKKNVVIFGYGGAGEAIFRCMYKFTQKLIFR